MSHPSSSFDKDSYSGPFSCHAFQNESRVGTLPGNEEQYGERLSSHGSDDARSLQPGHEMPPSMHYVAGAMYWKPDGTMQMHMRAGSPGEYWQPAEGNPWSMASPAVFAESTAGGPIAVDGSSADYASLHYSEPRDGRQFREIATSSTNSNWSTPNCQAKVNY